MRYLVLAVLTLSVVGVQDAQAQRLNSGLYKHKSKTCNQFCLQGNYDYRGDKRTGMNSVVAKADPIVVANLAGNATAQQIRFHVPVSGIKTDRVSLDRIGVSIFSTGKAVCTGILNHNGGIDGGLSGSNVTIRTRAYAGVRDGDTLLDAIMVWENSYDTWVYKNRPLAINFSNPEKQSDKLERFFQKITHLEIELEYTIDR